MSEEQLQRLVLTLEGLQKTNKEYSQYLIANENCAEAQYSEGRADAYEYALELVRRAQEGKL